MKLHGFLLPALAGTSAAKTTPRQAEAYILRQQHPQTTTSNPPSIPNELAEAILLQRLSSTEQPSTLGQLPGSLSEDDAVALINQFVKQSPPLFQDADAREPRQLVIAFSGVTPDRYDELKSAVSSVPVSFTAPELSRMSLRGASSCSFESSIDPQSSKCWKGETQYLQYDVTKDKSVISQFEANLPSLKAQASEGKLETTILFLAAPSSAGSDDELRRRNDRTEQVLTSNSDANFVKDAKASSKPPAKSFYSSAAADRPTLIPSCFASQNACVTATNDCSGHGACIDKWAGGSSENSCFFCRCQAAKEYDDAYKKDVLYQWGGGACQKRDISTPFWLFAGVSIALVGTIAFSIGLLFSIGEEKLPGVIGAGVSRSK